MWKDGWTPGRGRLNMPSQSYGVWKVPVICQALGHCGTPTPSCPVASCLHLKHSHSARTMCSHLLSPDPPAGLPAKAFLHAHCPLCPCSPTLYPVCSYTFRSQPSSHALPNCPIASPLRHKYSEIFLHSEILCLLVSSLSPLKM